MGCLYDLLWNYDDNDNIASNFIVDENKYI